MKKFISRKTAWLFGAALLSVAPAWAAPAADSAAGTDATVARVNGSAISAAELEFVTQQAQRDGVQITQDQREQLRQKLIDRQIALQEARRRGLERSADVKLRARLAAEDVAIVELGADLLRREPVTDAEIQAAYQEVVAGMKGKDYRVHHILTASEADAKAAQASLAAGESFEAVAQKLSIDKASAAQGGAVGWVRDAEYRPELLTALRSLKAGQVFSAPVQSPSGWHVVRLDEVRDTQAPSLEQIRPQLVQAIGQQKFARYQQQLRSQAKVQ